MSPGEMLQRLRDEVVKRTLESRLEKVADGGSDGVTPGNDASTPVEALPGLVGAADELIEGRLRVFATTHGYMGADPDWFFDPKSGLRAPKGIPFHKIGFREWPGSLKHVWEPSRHQHLTVLAIAARETGEDRYVDLLERQLTSWWEANPPFRGIHWVSGIEIGIRLISWVWIRRLLPDQDRARAMFESNDAFRRQLAAHQLWLAELPSLGSSANNHLVAEAAGLFASACFFPLLSRSDEWRRLGAERLEKVVAAQIGDDGVHAELATDYHGFVAELLIVAGLEGEAAGHPLSDDYWQKVRSMIDALAGLVDSNGRPPRQGDSDGGYGLLLDGPDFDRWSSLLRTGASLFRAAPWWRPMSGREDARSRYLAAAGEVRSLGGERPGELPGHFPEAGTTILRGADHVGREMWCSCDAGPIGYLKTAAHGHADALSIELRHAGVEVLVDPGTYCYQWDPVWRGYFRSTEAHNTVEIQGAAQAEPMGTFMWGRRVTPQTEHYQLWNGDSAVWAGSYAAKLTDGTPVKHQRLVEMKREGLEIGDQLDQSVPLTMRFHLGPAVACELDGATARLSWNVDQVRVYAKMHLPPGLLWEAVIARSEPPLGWYAPEFDELVPSVTLEGSGDAEVGVALVTQFRLVDT